jgi:hypothetical protein
MPIIFSPKNFFLATGLKREIKKIGVRLGEKGVCVLRTGSNQSSWAS